MQKIPAAFVIDEKYLFPALVAVYSFHKSKIIFEYTFFLSNFSEKNKTLFKQVLSKFGLQVKFVDIEIQQTRRALGYISNAMWGRLDLAKDYTDNFIYLDVDTLAHGQMAGDLINENFRNFIQSGFPIGAVTVPIEHVNELKKTNPLTISRTGNDYLNSGVLFINPLKWEKEKIDEKIDQLTISENPVNDQELLNNVFSGKYFHLNHNINKMVLNETTLEYSSGIYHYVGKLKPWNIYGFMQLAFAARVFGKNSIYYASWRAYNFTVRKMFIKLNLNPVLATKVCFIQFKEKVSPFTQIKWLIKGNISA
jgi:lipopolysaccharide biosynthesis glycosyltransferase